MTVNEAAILLGGKLSEHGHPAWLVAIGTKDIDGDTIYLYVAVQKYRLDLLKSYFRKIFKTTGQSQKSGVFSSYEFEGYKVEIVRSGPARPC